MGLEILEQKYQNYIKKYPEKIPLLESIAGKICAVQKEMRGLLDGITAEICKDCRASCCECMPVEGWFTEGDYFIYRLRFAAPFDLRVPHDMETGCAFLGRQGCVLPPDIRPFPCVKVNCRAVSEALSARGSAEAFKRLHDELSGLQEKIWPLLSEYLSGNVIQAQSR